MSQDLDSVGEHPTLANKVALITGGARGIGLAVALCYARAGAKVFLVSRNEASVRAGLAKLRSAGAIAAGGACDLAQNEACENLPRMVMKTFGRIDILVNNAAILGPRVSILNYPSEQWSAVLRTNLDSVFWLSKATAALMIPNGGGTMINVSSGVARKGRANWGAYAVSKAALENFTEVFADEAASLGIRINSINPGATRTSMRAAAFPEENPNNLPPAESIVKPFLWLASDASKGVTGCHFNARDFS